jgi:hypothetical protein
MRRKISSSTFLRFSASDMPSASCSSVAPATIAASWLASKSCIEVGVSGSLIWRILLRFVRTILES